MWTVIGESEEAIAQSHMDMMSMMTGDGNMTDGGMMMGGSGANMSLPFNMGVLAMPLMCTTPNQLLGSMTGDDDNATRQMMMGLMQQQMMSMENMTGFGGMENMTGFGGLENMSEAALQQAMNLVICIPMMNEEMMQSMMGNGQNSMLMNGMPMQ